MVVIERDCEAASEVITVGGYRLSDDHSELEPPDPIPNSVVKRLSADGSLGFPHVRVGHRQALIPKKARPFKGRAFFLSRFTSATWSRPGVAREILGCSGKTARVVGLLSCCSRSGSGPRLGSVRGDY